MHESEKLNICTKFLLVCSFIFFYLCAVCSISLKSTLDSRFMSQRRLALFWGGGGLLYNGLCE